MKALIFDTETNGVKSGHREVLQLSWLIMNDDLTLGNPRRTETVYMKREIELNPEAVAVNGITQENLMNGVDPMGYYNYTFLPLIQECDFLVGIIRTQILAVKSGMMPNMIH
jgi:DNA polymerase III epsilon subunit-like protein